MCILFGHVCLWCFFLSLFCRGWHTSLLTDDKEIAIVKTLVDSAQAMESQAHSELQHLTDRHYDHTDNVNPNSQRMRNKWQSSIATVSHNIGVRKELRSKWGRYCIDQVSFFLCTTQLYRMCMPCGSVCLSSLSVCLHVVVQHILQVADIGICCIQSLTYPSNTTSQNP